MHSSSSVHCGGTLQPHFHQSLTWLCARLLTVLHALLRLAPKCSPIIPVTKFLQHVDKAAWSCHHEAALLASILFGIGTDEVLQEQQPVALEEAPTSPKAIWVQPAASAPPRVYCRVTSAPSSKHPLLPCQPSSAVLLRSIPIEGKAIAQHRSSDAQPDSRDMEPAAAGQYHRPSISIVQGSMPGDKVRCAPAASCNIVTSGEYASVNKREIALSIAPRSPLSAPPHRHLISDVITGSDSSQELPNHHSKQQDFGGGLGQTLSELQDHARLRAICHKDTCPSPGQAKSQPGSNNDDNIFFPDFQQPRHAFPEDDIRVSDKSVKDSSSWSWASADADSFQHQNCFFEQDGTLAVSLPSASRKQEAWYESWRQQQQQQKVCTSSSFQDAPAQGSAEWEPMPCKTVDMITSMDDTSDDGFVAEASRWIVQNYGSHIPSAGELLLPCTCLIRDKMPAYIIVCLSTIVHAALLWVLPDSDL